MRVMAYGGAPGSSITHCDVFLPGMVMGPLDHKYG